MVKVNISSNFQLNKHLKVQKNIILRRISIKNTKRLITHYQSQRLKDKTQANNPREYKLRKDRVEIIRNNIS